ncbi:MAG: SH3 domain-containing protein [Acidimicrobiia bacterium]|nr:SH3 domain-containing protein [Acidimicrobiia bacterium]
MRRVVLAAVVGLLVAACAPSSSVTTTLPPVGPTTTVVTTTSQQTTTTAAPTTTTIPGEPIDIGPREGDILMVVGVAHDDLLNLRALPGPDQEILGRIPPTYEDLKALGETRSLPNALWVKVSYQGMTGWVHMSFVGYMGPTDDLTHQVVADLGGYPTATDMTALGAIVANTFASEEPASLVVIVVEESVGDLGEVTYDVVGIGDDAVLGFRIHVFGEPGTGGLSLVSAEVTTVCGRGISPDGLCP